MSVTYHTSPLLRYGHPRFFSAVLPSTSPKNRRPCLVLGTCGESRMSYRSNTRGVTFLELIIAVGILGLLLAVITPSFLNFRRNSILNTETQEVITIINKARLSAMSSKGDMKYGVHLESGKIVLFPGTIYTGGASGNEEHILNSALTFSVITVNGGGANVVFEKITGATSQNATTTLLVTGSTASTTIVIHPTGIASMQ